LISNSSGLDTAFIAFLYANVPAAVFEDKSYPCEFPAMISFPKETTLFGLNPSKPPWKGTKNFLELIEVALSFNEIADVLGDADDGKLAPAS